MIKKADILLFLCLLVFGIAVSWFSLSGSIAGEKVRVTVDGELYGVYSLDQDQRIEIAQNGHTHKRRYRRNDFFFLQESGLRRDRCNLAYKGQDRLPAE